MKVKTSFTFVCVMSFILIAFFSADSASAKSDDFFFENLILAGNLSLRSGNVSGAVRDFEQAEKMEPKNADALIGLIRAYTRSGNFENAQIKLDLFRKCYPYDMRGVLVGGEYLAGKGHIEEATEEFISLIEKGIYRFEALQALIVLYAESGDPMIKSVIDETIPLYEQENQATLYDLLFEKLLENNKSSEAYGYKLIHDTLVEADELEDQSYDEIHPLEIALMEAQNFIDMGAYKAAEEVLGEATSKWPYDPRLQVMLKKCYMDMLDDVPVISEDEKSLTAGFSDLLPSKGMQQKSLNEMIPASADFSDETTVYLDRIVKISEETEKYFTKMLGNLSALQNKLNRDSSGYRNGNMQQDMRELQTLLKESAKVCDLENEALDQLAVPENFAGFHEYLKDTVNLLSGTFKRIDYLIASQNWTEYFIVVKMLEDLETRTDKLDQIFMEAIDIEIGDKPTLLAAQEVK